jgi:hypothetical protein
MRAVDVVLWTSGSKKGHVRVVYPKVYPLRAKAGPGPEQDMKRWSFSHLSVHS